MAAAVREARKSDKEPLMGFIRENWGGHDYIPTVWDRWLRSADGKMFVVEVHGKPVGMSRVRFLEDGLAWFEGARVNPEYRGRGFATLLTRRSIWEAQKNGVRVCRLTSNSRNEAAHRQVAKNGFKEVSRMSLYEPEEGAKFPHWRDVRRAMGRDLPEVRERVFSSKEYREGGGVFWDSFTAISLTAGVLARLVKEGSVLLTHEAVAVTKAGGEGRESWNQVCFVTGEPSGAIKLIGHVFAGRTRKRDSRVVYIPQGSRLVGELRHAGFGRRGSFILFERREPHGSRH